MATAIIKHASNGLKHRGVRDYLKMRFGKAAKAAVGIAKHAAHKAAPIVKGAAAVGVGGYVAKKSYKSQKGDTVMEKAERGARAGAAGVFAGASAAGLGMGLGATRHNVKSHYKDILRDVGRSAKAPRIRKMLRDYKGSLRTRRKDMLIGSASAAGISGLAHLAAKQKNDYSKYQAKADKKQIKASNIDLLFAKMDLILGYEPLELALSPKEFGTVIGRKAAKSRVGNLATQAKLQSQVRSPMMRSFGKKVSRFSSKFTRPIMQGAASGAAKVGGAVAKAGGAGRAGLIGAAAIGTGVLAHKAAKRLYGGGVKASQESIAASFDNVLVLDAISRNKE